VSAQDTRARGPIVGIAASAGGPAALAAILADIAGVRAPLLIVQHLHHRFLNEFVAWMTRISVLPVDLAVDGARLHSGHVYLAAPGLHLKLGHGRTAILDADPPSIHRPSADEMFFSIARYAGADGIGVVLTGMGDDGAAGLRILRLAGGTTLVQDMGSSAVHGMPSAVERMGAAERQVPLARIGAAIRSAVGERAR
jgi:two-component system chemotaxis response regulator CheB